jgi:hypothetical protein
VRLDEAELEAIDEAAELRGVSRSQFVREACADASASTRIAAAFGAAEEQAAALEAQEDRRPRSCSRGRGRGSRARAMNGHVRPAPVAANREMTGITGPDAC